MQDENEADILITSDTIIRRYDTLNPAPAGFENLDGFYISIGTADISQSVAFCSQESAVVDKWMENLQNFQVCLRTIKQVNEASGDPTTFGASVTGKFQGKQGWLITNTPNDAEQRPLWVELKGPLPYKLSLFTSKEVATSGDVPEFEFNITDAWKVERSSKNSTLRIVSGAGKKVLLVLSAKPGEEACLIHWQKKINNAARELSKMDLGIVKEGNVMRKSGASSNMVQLTLLTKSNFESGSYICSLRLKDGEKTKTHFITHRSSVKYAEDGFGFQKDCNLELRIKKTRKLVFVMKNLDEMLKWGNALSKQIDICKIASFGSKVLTYQALAIFISENLMPDSGQPLTTLDLQMLLAEDPEFRDFLDESLAGGSRALLQQIEDHSGINDTGVMEDIVLLLTRQLLEKRNVSIPAEGLPAILKLSAKGRVNTVDSLMGNAEIKLFEGVKVKLEACDPDDASGAYDFHKRFVEFSADEVFIYKDETRLKILNRIKLHGERLLVEHVLDANERLVLQVDPFFQIYFTDEERQLETGWINALKTMANLGKELASPTTFQESEAVGATWRGYPVLWRGRLVILTPEFLGPLPEGTKFRARPRRCILTNNRLWFQISEHGTYSFITITKFTQVSTETLVLCLLTVD